MRCLNSLITRNIPEGFTLSKNMCIYRLNWAWIFDLALHLQSKAQMKCLDVNHFHYVASI